MVRPFFVRIDPFCFSVWWRRVEMNEDWNSPRSNPTGKVRHVDGPISQPLDDDGKEWLVPARADTFNRLCQKRITKERCFSAKFTRQDNKCKWIVEREREKGKSQLSFINITSLQCSSFSPQATAGNIGINVVNDDKYFPGQLSLSLSVRITPKLTKNNLSRSLIREKNVNSLLFSQHVHWFNCRRIEGNANRERSEMNPIAFLFFVILSICKWITRLERKDFFLRRRRSGHQRETERKRRNFLD